MAEFYPLPLDLRRRIEKWLKEHLDEMAVSDDIPCVVTRNGSNFDHSTFAKIQPRYLSSTAMRKFHYFPPLPTTYMV